jgi:DNA primase
MKGKILGCFMNESEINAVRQSADIVDIISDYLPLTQKGQNFVAVCPFHDDHHPSMVVSREKQIFNCFTCHTGGNVFNFVMKYENVSFLEAVKIVADKIGMNVHLKISSNVNNVKFVSEYKLMNLANKYFMNILNTSAGLDAKKYLNERGIDEKIIKEFNLGLSLNDPKNLYNFLSKNNFSVNEMADVGLVNKSGLDTFDVFNNRIMIPITNINGQIVGFTGRIFHNEDTAKYLNTKETVIFKKGEIIFNYFNAKNYVRQGGNIIIVEGNMDAIKMASSGIKNVVALMGVAVSSEHVNFLKKLRVPIILMLDNDEAGLMGTVKNGDILYKSGLDLEVVRLTGAKDPDEFIRKFGVEKLKEKIKNSVKYLDFKVNYLKKDKNLSSTSDLVAFIKEVGNLIDKDDTLTRNVLISKIAKEENLDAKFLSEELFKKTNNISLPVVNENKPKRLDKYNKLANDILFYILNDIKYLSIFNNEIGFFEEKDDRDLINEINYYTKNHDEYLLADFISYLSFNENLLDKVINITNEKNNDSMNYTSFIDLICGLKKYYKEEKINKLKEQIKNETDCGEKIKLMEKLTKVKKESVDYGRN